MRFKIFSIFLIIQFISFGIWNVTISKEVSDENSNIIQTIPTVSRVYPVHAASNEEELQEIPVEAQLEIFRPQFSAQNMAAEEEAIYSIRQHQILSAFAKLPQEHVESVKNIILDYNPDAHRGLGGNFMIILRAVGMESEEFVSVLIHELAHNVDYAHLTHAQKNRKSPFKDGNFVLYETDPSLDFYRISWLKTDKMKSKATNMDFISGYAMSDPFEDFAETYAYYVLHNADFKAMIKTSEALEAKYNFMKNMVFEGQEFDTADGIVGLIQRPWDTTVLPYDLEAFMG